MPPVTIGYRPASPSPQALYWAAEQVLRQHAEPASEHRATGRCKQCGPDGCQLLSWAQAVVPAGASVAEPHGDTRR